jgi:hypothetical protein
MKTLIILLYKLINYFELFHQLLVYNKPRLNKII